MSAKDRYSTAVEAFNRGDAAGFAALYAADGAVIDPLYPQPLQGRDAIEQDIRDVMRAFPDARFELMAVLENGATAAVQYRVTGTNTGPLATPGGEIPATGRRLDSYGAAFSRLSAGGEVEEERRYFDVATWFRQLGIAD
jgi:steroid delta-isomerase-like uncharacterized protein